MSTARVENRQRWLNGLPPAAPTRPHSARDWLRDPIFWLVTVLLVGGTATVVLNTGWFGNLWLWAGAGARVAVVIGLLAIREWGRRALSNPKFWLALILLPAYAWMLYAQYWMLHPAEVFDDGTQTLGITNEAFLKAGFWAMWTALAYVVLFIWLDRFRGSSPLIWLLTFLWGACASTWLSIHANSWAAERMSTTQADAFAGSRAAVFSAPFVEEVTKATILILLVILMRRKIVSRLSMVALSGLAAVGFAFTENIIYYGRVWMQATNDISIADPDKTMMELVMLRGVYTSFGHPLFTMMTAGGLVIGLSARSKIVRVLAPVGGFLLSCAGHMLFNGLASTNHPDNLMGAWYLALGLVGVIVISLIVSVIGNGQVLKARLTDYERAGWISKDDVAQFGGPLRRLKLLWFALWRGPKKLIATATLVRRYTELAYLRDAMTRGTVDGGGDLRAHDLIQEIERLPAARSRARPVCRCSSASRRRPRLRRPPARHRVRPPRSTRRRNTRGRLAWAETGRDEPSPHRRVRATRRGPALGPIPPAARGGRAPASARRAARQPGPRLPPAPGHPPRRAAPGRRGRIDGRRQVHPRQFPAEGTRHQTGRRRCCSGVSEVDL